ncbi:MAG: polysaccharide deacetylase family protein [Nitrososphaera sp.]|nr:polysaccharide deacetylase family protein [Nitrososphaera sp.]
MIPGSNRTVRLDRFLTLYVFGPLISLSGRLHGLKIPILMYHSITKDLDEKVHPYFRTATSPEVFERHMAWLSQSGFQALTLSEAVRILQGFPDQPVNQPALSTELLKSPTFPNLLRRPVVVTFDDGFQDFYTTAFPIVERYGFRATVFLASRYIGKTFLTGRHCLRVQEIRELVTKGVEFGSHTVNHPQLKELSRNEIIYELADSKKFIEDITGSEVSLFSYPYRFPEEDCGFTRKLDALLIEHGYSVGVTTAIGLSKPSDNPLFLRRLPVNDCDDEDLFEAKLQGAYDWMHKGQLTYKRLRAVHRT